jgi:hypothetical protein
MWPGLAPGSKVGLLAQDREGRCSVGSERGRWWERPVEPAVRRLRRQCGGRRLCQRVRRIEASGFATRVREGVEPDREQGGRVNKL